MSCESHPCTFMHHYNHFTRFTITLTCILVVQSHLYVHLLFSLTCFHTCLVLPSYTTNAQLTNINFSTTQSHTNPCIYRLLKSVCFIVSVMPLRNQKESRYGMEFDHTCGFTLYNHRHTNVRTCILSCTQVHTEENCKLTCLFFFS